MLVMASVIFPQYYHEYHQTDDTVFKIVTYGPSDDIFIWWGHAALIVENTRWNFSRVYDWGVFSYEGDDFLKEFLGDRIRYKCDSGFYNNSSYLEEDRDITVYTLNPDRRGKIAILDYVESKTLPENCYYEYHEFRDNCSTGIRDLLDIGTDGQFKAEFESIPGRFSYRQQVRRYTWFRPFADWFLGFLMGQDLDEEISVWDEMFLPIEIARNIVEFSFIDEFGVKRPMVNSVSIVNSSKERQPILNEPLETWPFTLALGILCAIFIFTLAYIGDKFPRISRVSSGIIHSFMGLFFGASGFVLCFGFSMNNDYFKQNINILFINPLLLIIVPLGIMMAINRPRYFLRKINPERIIRIIWTYVFIAAAISALLWLLPFFFQQNQSVICLILPIAFALSSIPEKLYSWFST